MKNADNKEIDLLLRSLARDSSPDIGGPIAGGNGEIGQHLDADELNTFAEGLVPDGSRARYMEHLAECASCRGIVVGLSQTAGSKAALRTDRKTESGLWQKFALFLTPSLLRYAMPLLVLAAIVGVSLMLFRHERRQELLAQKEDYSGRVSIVAEPTPGGPSASADNERVAGFKRSPELRAETDLSKERMPAPAQTERTKSSTNSDQVAAVPSLSQAMPPPPLAAPAYQAGRDNPPFAPEPKPGTASSGTAILNDVNKPQEVGKQDTSSAETGFKQRRAEEASIAANKDSADKSSSKVSGPRRVEGLMTERRGFGVKDKKESREEDETRTVSGRRFRRAGNAWIDTAYDSSGRTINLSRGSEQFRALVADEPSIRTIANELGGEVIVVWKGKAYRIR